MLKQAENELDDALWEELHAKVARMIEQIGDRSPHIAGADGQYDNAKQEWWTSGFWPGLLWLMYDKTGDEQFKEAAWHWDTTLERYLIGSPQELHHDVGFQFLLTAVMKYEITGNEDSLRIGLEAANYLAGRFNPAGGFIRAWNGDKYGWAIIDCMMNVSLLFWASRVSNDPRFKHIAMRHADTAMQNFIRPDGSVKHIVSFDPESGEYIEALGGQGNAPDSAWSRGASWALYGFANTYKHTGEERYLNAAKRVAHYFIASLPEDAVPYWDFRLASLDGEPRDTSAGAIAASGLLELAEALPAVERRLYEQSAKRILHSLSEHYSTRGKPEHHAILVEGTGHKPAGQNVNVSLIYGDYYYVEALAKLAGWERRIF